MNSYPTTRHGKIHVRASGTIMKGETLCGRLNSSGSTVSPKAGHVATCKKCKSLFVAIK